MKRLWLLLAAVLGTVGAQDCLGGGAQAPSGLLCELMEHPELVAITNANPQFGWIYQPTRKGDGQSAYRILVASSAAQLQSETGDLWDSGRVATNQSLNIPYAGAPLQAAHTYWWRVRTWDSRGQASAYSEPQSFNTTTATNAWANRYPLLLTPVAPTTLVQTSPTNWFIDFGQDAFGFLRLSLTGALSGVKLEVRFGEMASGCLVVTNPGGTIRYASTTVTLQNGAQTYDIHPPSISGSGVSLPPSIGVVLPFRYLELRNCPVALTANHLRQMVLHYQFNDTAATFSSSSAVLNEVWQLCHYSIKATSFAGVYVDGDRERKPYEADAYINQLSQYAVDREYTLARYSQQYLLAHPTWPTEWKFHSILVAWTDYQWTGDLRPLVANYAQLKSKLFLDRARADGLIQGFPNYPQAANSDVVDWPVGERDGFIISSGTYSNQFNAVINSFYYGCLRIMAQVATLTGHASDSLDFASRADTVYTSFNTVFWSPSQQRYVDGEGTTHASAHASFFPLAFGLVPPDRQGAVVSFLQTKGMPCSVYGAQYLFEGLYLVGAGDYALSLLTATGLRSWHNMSAVGSTITLEAWDKQYKSNLDWNHAWGAAAGNLIARYLLGVRPLEPGWGRALIQPQVGSLSYAEATLPTIRGPLFIRVQNKTNDFRVQAVIPGNMTARVLLPAQNASSPVAIVDGTVMSGTLSNGWLVLENISSGQHAVWLSVSNNPSQARRFENWQAANFGTNAANLALADDTADPDGDGQNNFAEFVAGTDPLDPASVLASSIPSVAPSGVSVSLPGYAGRRYTLQRKAELINPDWTAVVTNTLDASNGPVTLVDPQCSLPQAFYRVRVEAP